MTTRNSNIDSDTNQITAFSESTHTVLVADTRDSEKYHKPLGGTLSSCGRHNSDLEREELAEVDDE